MALPQHLRHFAAGFILSEGIAILIVLPLSLLLLIMDRGNYSLPDAVWIAVIFYDPFSWSLIIPIEQMCAAGLFLWHLKWCRENKKLASRNLPPVLLAEITCPSLLDNIAAVLHHQADATAPCRK